jgi:hypothetical protein
MGDPAFDRKTAHCVKSGLTARRTAGRMAQGNAHHQQIRLPRNNGFWQNNVQ